MRREVEGDALRLADIVVSFGGRPVLSGVGLCVPAGGVVVVMGASGAGKTTLLRVAAGLLRPERGVRECASVPVGFVFQEPRLLPWRTARQNVLFALGRRARAADRVRADELLARLGLSAAAEMFPVALSGGMRQRVAIARAVIASPRLMLLDEPLSALDAAHRERLAPELVSELTRVGAATLWATHDPGEAARVADQVLILPAEAGRAPPRLVRPALPRALRSEADVSRLADRLIRLMRGGPPHGELDTPATAQVARPPCDRPQRLGRRRDG